MKTLISLLSLISLAGCATRIPAGSVSGTFVDPKTGTSVTVTVTQPPASQPAK